MINTTNIKKRKPIPSPIEIPTACEATPVANGLTVEAKQPTCEPTKTIATATTVSKPTAIITGISNA